MEMSAAASLCCAHLGQLFEFSWTAMFTIRLVHLQIFSAVCHLFLLSSHLNLRDVVSAIMLHHSVLCKAFGMRALYVANAIRSFTQLAVLSRLLCDVSALFTVHSRSPIDMPSCVCSNYSRLLKGIVIVALPVLLGIYLLPVCAICCVP
jgi:hypothetical protein